MQWDSVITQVLRSTSESHRIFNALWNLDHSKVRLLPSSSLPEWHGAVGVGCWHGAVSVQDTYGRAVSVRDTCGRGVSVQDTCSRACTGL